MYVFFLKRLFDLFIALLFLTIASPIFFVTIIILKFTGEGEVFYLQNRVGFNNKNFKIFKFATMVKDSPNIGTGSLTLRNDPRVLPFGKFLRKSKINEFPQIFNVLLGNMSIVGPRPQMKVDFLVYPEHIRDLIYLTKPGITGLGSIIFRDEEKLISNATNPKQFYSDKIAPYKGSLEVWYNKNVSFFNDIIIIFLTAWVILFPNTKLTYKILRNIPPKPPHLV
tara:strand:- start:785 stop:1456 length:672 start_codon:yes stop_codon:yes gene_type:complete